MLTSSINIDIIQKRKERNTMAEIIEKIITFVRDYIDLGMSPVEIIKASFEFLMNLFAF